MTAQHSLCTGRLGLDLVVGLGSITLARDPGVEVRRRLPQRSGGCATSLHPGAVILPELGEKLGAYGQKKLAERGVEIRVNTSVKGLSERGVELSDGTMIETNTLVWTAGTTLVLRVPANQAAG